MTYATRAALAAALLAAVACADPAGTAPTDELTTPNGPESGAVVKTEAPFTWFLVDAESGLQAHFGRDIVSLCQGNGANLDTLQITVITNPQEALRQLRKVRGDVKTSVWPIGANTCARYATETPLATGMSYFRGTDNDVAPFNRPDPKNTNAFGFMANGKLTGADGNTMNFQATYRGTWDGTDVTTIREHTNISLH